MRVARHDDVPHDIPVSCSTVTLPCGMTPHVLRAFVYGVATISRLLKNVGLFCERALQKRLYSAKETCNSKEPTNRSHPIAVACVARQENMAQEITVSCSTMILACVMTPYVLYAYSCSCHVCSTT